MDPQNKQVTWDVLTRQELPDDRLIYELSGLLSEEIDKFETIWDTLPKNLKQQLITKLRDIAESDFAVDFYAIFRIGLNSDDPDICISAMGGLSENEDIQKLPRLYYLLQNHRDARVRIAAAQTLADFVLLGELGKIHSNIFHKTVSKLLESYNHPTEVIEVKSRILEAVAYTGISNIPQLIQNAYTNPDEKMRISAVCSMGRSADKRWADIVQKELFNSDPKMRLVATRACGELQVHDAVSKLQDLTDDTDIQVQELALWSLGQIGGSKARRTLEKYLQSESVALCTAAQQAIDELDFSQNSLSSFLGPPSEFDGEGEESWLSPEGLPIGNEADVYAELDQFDDDFIDIDQPEENNSVD